MTSTPTPLLRKVLRLTAGSPDTPQRRNPSTPHPFRPCSSSKSLSEVFLSDWWLVTLEPDGGGRRLGVGGFVHKGLHLYNIFSSTHVVKRLDECTVEVADGVTVMIEGPINKDRTIYNGFPPEASDHFMKGFPFAWDSYAHEYFTKGSNEDGRRIASPIFHSSLPSATGCAGDTILLASTLKSVVTLVDWWLVKSGKKWSGKQLAIGGCCHGSRVPRVSAPIVKRFDAYTLETAAKATIIIEGLLNQIRTESNGFPSEVCRDFKIGFPEDWEEHVSQYFPEVPPSGELHSDIEKNISSETPGDGNHKVHSFAEDCKVLVCEYPESVAESRNHTGSDRGNYTREVFEQGCPSVDEVILKKYPMTEHKSSDEGNSIAETLIGTSKEIQPGWVKGSEDNQTAVSLAELPTANAVTSTKELTYTSETTYKIVVNKLGKKAFDEARSPLRRSIRLLGSEASHHRTNPTQCIGRTDKVITPDNRHDVCDDVPGSSIGYDNKLGKMAFDEARSPLRRSIRLLGSEASHHRTNTTQCTGRTDKVITPDNRHGVRDDVPGSPIGYDNKRSSHSRKGANVQLNNGKGESTQKKAKKNPHTSEALSSPISPGKSFCSVEVLNFKRSKSGRLLVPKLDQGSQEIIYDFDGMITGIASTSMDMLSPGFGRKSEPSKKRKRKK